MTDPARARRLARLECLEVRRRRLAEQAFARSVREAAEAAAGVARIEGLLLVTGPVAGVASATALAAAAQLRDKLEAAAGQARDRLQRAQNNRFAAEALLGEAATRARRVGDLLREAQRRAHRHAEGQGR
jgi:hypothetical protein